MSVNPEQKTVDALREWLLLGLPAKVAEVNADRTPRILSPIAGPYLVAASQKLRISFSSLDETAGFTDVPLTAGAARTATQIAADITSAASALPGFGAVGVDSAERWYVESTAPTAARKMVAFGLSTSPNTANSLFGFNPGGVKRMREPLVSPTESGIMDGWPAVMDGGAGFWVIIGDRESVKVDRNPRRDESLVALELTICYRPTNLDSSRTREGITSCARAVRELLTSATGKRLGVGGAGVIEKVDVTKVRIPGKPFSFKSNTPNPLFDLCMMQVDVRVYEVPA